MNTMIIGFCGFIGSGKDTAADYLVNNFNFEKDSFAKSLKDVLAVLFNWDRFLLEGKTPESRAWREQVDYWWAKKLDIPNFTPRWAMQNIGTDLFRNHFHTNIWVSTLENRLKSTTKNVVISDLRFSNEMQTIKNLGGIIVRIVRGSDPLWYNDAILANRHNAGALEKIKQQHIHPSEWEWINDYIDLEIKNNNTIEDFNLQIKNLVLNHLVSTAI